jgi:hypothetical protein
MAASSHRLVVLFLAPTAAIVQSGFVQHICCAPSCLPQFHVPAAARGCASLRQPPPRDDALVLQLYPSRAGFPLLQLPPPRVGFAALPLRASSGPTIFDRARVRLALLLNRADAAMHGGGEGDGGAGALLSGLVAGFVSFHAFPLVERAIRSLGFVAHRVGSGYTTDVWGAFCPAVGILFATLISSTVDRMWARQEALRSKLIAETSLLSSLTQLLDEADRSDMRDELQRAKEAAIADAQAAVSVVAAPLHEQTLSTADQPLRDDASPHGASVSSASSETVVATSAAADWIAQQAAATHAERGGKHEAGGASDGASVGMSSATAGGPADEPRGSVRPTRSGSVTSGGMSGAPAPCTQQVESFWCVAKHLHTLSHLVWGSRGAAGGGGRATPSWLGASKAPQAAYTAELAAIGSGQGVDPLVDLMRLFRPREVAKAPTAWRTSSAEARALVGQLMVLRGERLAALESTPPLAHWVVLAFTGTSLIFGFAVVSVSTREASCILSRALFTCLTGALLAVLRLLVDLAEPFDGHGYTLAAKNAAGAYLAPTRRRLVAALTRPRPKQAGAGRLRTAAARRPADAQQRVGV